VHKAAVAALSNPLDVFPQLGRQRHGYLFTVRHGCSLKSKSRMQYRGKSATHRDWRLMDRKTRELALLCVLACACIALATAFGRPLFIAIFAVEAAWALFMAVYRSVPPD
jgi:hypothetical protein